VNPEHLKLGTNSENLRQFFTENGRVQRRHFRDPRKHSHAKLTWEKVVKIRNQYAAGFHSAAELARNFGVSSNTIRAIAQNRIWKWKDKESWVNSQKHQI
jgi:DNA invertase Pin-like site-specific DNA recombinase